MSERVYSTEEGDLRGRRDDGVPEAPSGPPRVSLEKRRGKAVTLVHDVPADDLRTVAAELKRRCSSGGTVKNGVIEIQGDHREAVAALLQLRSRR
jgi:translation initiation factor 1